MLSSNLPQDERTDRIWRRITTCVEMIKMLAEDTMHYYQIEAGQFHLTLDNYHLSDIVESAATIAMPIAVEKGVQFSIGAVPAMQLHVDRSAVIQIMLNLLTNAINYTQPEGQVWLCLHDLVVSDYALPLNHYPPVLALPNAGLLVEVIDTGQGIAPEDHERIFREFDRSSAQHTPDEKGVGLGLPVSQRLVRLHGGEIWFISEPGQGTTFAFFIPLDSR
jgi:signal transduction histidine kinase